MAYYVIFTVLATGSHRMRSEFEDLLVQHTRSENIGSGETWKSPNTVGRSFRALNSCTGSGAWVWRFLLKIAVVHHGFSSWAIRLPSRTIDKEHAQVHQQQSRLRLRGDLSRTILTCSRHVCGGRQVELSERRHHLRQVRCYSSRWRNAWAGDDPGSRRPEQEVPFLSLCIHLRCWRIAIHHQQR